MAEDIKIKWDNDKQTGDFGLVAGDLEREDGLESAVLISLFTDQRADDDDDLENPLDKRGWWGDQIPDVQDDQIGSKLWLLDRNKLSNDTLNKIRQYAYDCLEWMITDGVVANVIPEVERDPNDRNRVNMAIRIYREDDGVVVFKFKDLWDSLDYSVTRSS